MDKRLAIIPVLCLAILAVWHFSSPSKTETSKFPFEIGADGVPKIKKPSKDQRILGALLENKEKTMDPALGYAPSERIFKVYELINKKREQLAMGRISGLVTDSWKERGPYSVGGRTRILLIDKNDPTNNTLFSASVSGGLWKTDNINRSPPNWIPVNDNFQNLAICALAQSDSDPQIMYFGTGEGYANFEAVRGAGIWKSTDGGDTWTHLQSTANNSTFYYTVKLLLHPSGDLYAVTLDGLQRSKDGGQTWMTLLSGSVGNGRDDMTDLEIGADGTLYATGGHRGGGGSLWRSDPGPTVGDVGTWQNKSDGINNNSVRIEIATAPSAENIIYAAATVGNSVETVYRSTNRGDTWVARTQPAAISNQAWYNLCLAVDPNNSNRVIFGDLALSMTTDGGATWTLIGQNVHPDNHTILYEPGNSNVAYFGNDGGIYKVTNASSSPSSLVFTHRNDGFNVTQFYACAIHPDLYSNYFLAGSQDNGTQQFTRAGLGRTSSALGGDGAYCHIDQNEPDIQIASTQNGNYVLSKDGGESFFGGGISINVGFINDSDYDNDANILYAYGGGGNFRRWDISKDTMDAVTISNSGGFFRQLTVSPNTANRIFIGSSAGQVMRIDDANQGLSVTGVDISGNLPNGFISCIAIEKGNDDHLIVSYSNYGVNSVWETTDGGSNWTSVEGDLPDMPVRWAMFHPTEPSQVFLATEAGVWSTNMLNAGSTEWAPNLSLPSTRTDMLQYRESDNLMAAATHGRGLWTNDALSPPVAVAAFDQVSYLSADQQFTDASVNPDNWAWDFGDGSSSTLQNPRHSYSAIGTYEVTLTINGSLTTKNSIKILPDRALPYVEDAANYGGGFEGQPEDFGVVTKSGSSFEKGKSTQPGKSGTHSGNNAWVVGLNDPYYEFNTETYLYTPNYDLSEPGIYEFSFWSRYVTQLGFHGFRVEYSIDKGDLWEVLGEEADSWYNYTNANAGSETIFPAGSDYFSGATNGSQFKRFYTDLNDLVGNANVAFRFVLKTSSTGRFAGVAIDDVEVNALKGESIKTQIISFAGNYTSFEEVELNWVTSPEFQCKGFEIETSVNGVEYNKVQSSGFINGQGSSLNENGYIEIPEEAFKRDVHYFRIRVYDFDDNSFTSEVLALRREQDAPVALVLTYPNPFTDEINLIFDRNVSEEEISIELFDALGKLMLEQQNVPVMDVNYLLKLPSLARGTYVLRVRIGEEKITKKVVRK